jgi:dienelactone hydrolase
LKRSHLTLLIGGGVLAIAFAALSQPASYRPVGDPALVQDLLPTARDYVPPQGITFKTTDFVSENVRLKAQWFYAASNEGRKLPTVIMAHGWGATAANFREDAIDLARAGYLVMLFDYRGWGESDGRVMLTGGRPPAAKASTAQVRELRGYFDPWEQNEDWFNAISYAVTNPMVDEGRIGIRGSGESGGHVIYVAAHEPRVKAVVSQVSRLDFRPSRAPAEAIVDANATAARIAAGQAQYPPDRSRAVGKLVGEAVGNKLVRWAPLEQADRVTAPVLFFLVQNEELFSNADNGQRACQLVKGPRKMVIGPNMTHYDVYGVDRWKPVTLAIDWFDKYLKPAGAPTRIPVNRTEPERGECEPDAKLEIEGIGAGRGLEKDDKDAQGKVGTAGAPPPQDASGRWN